MIFVTNGVPYACGGRINEGESSATPDVGGLTWFDKEEDDEQCDPFRRFSVSKCGDAS